MIKILKLLEENARLTPKEIAELTDYPEEEIKNYIQKMEHEGVIKKYKTVINWEKVSEEMVYAIIDVRISLERGLGYDFIAKRIARFPEVRDIRLVSGDYDLSISVRGKTMKEVAFFVAEKIATMEQVRETNTHFLLRSYKENGDLMFEDEGDKRLAFSP